MFGKKNRKPRPNKKAAPATINNFVVNTPQMAQSLNIYPIKQQQRDVEDVKQVVNGKVADDKLIHKPKNKDVEQTFFPSLNSSNKQSGRSSKTSRRKTNT